MWPSYMSQRNGQTSTRENNQATMIFFKAETHLSALGGSGNQIGKVGETVPALGTDFYLY